MVVSEALGRESGQSESFRGERIRILTVNDRVALVTSRIGPLEMVDEWLQPQWNTDDAQGLENENARSNGNDKFNRPFANMGYLVNNVARRVFRPS